MALLVILSLFCFTASAWAQVDLSLTANVSKSKPAIGETITYAITVKNSGLLAASGVVVKDSLSAGGVSYIGNSLVRGGVSYAPATGLWNVGTLAPGDSAILQISARVLAQGVYFAVAEVVAMDQQDLDSWPGDGALDQDDFATACFSVPILWVPGDEFTVSVPSGYRGIQWFYNGLAINGSAVFQGSTVATVNADSTLTIKGPGSYTFVSTVGIACPASGCCAIEIVAADAFDLALRKTLAPGQTSAVKPGDLVKFRLWVVNQGRVAATQIALKDSLPASLTLADGLWTASGSGSVATLNTPIPGPLAPGDSVSVDILVRLNAGFSGPQIVNFAQVQSANTANGQPASDQDSTPGNGYTNGEDDEASITVVLGNCPTTTPPVVSAAVTTVCPGTAVVLKSAGCAGGTTQWSNGMTGDSISVVVNATTSYTAFCQIGTCTSAASNSLTITTTPPVRPVLVSTAGTVCVGGSATLTATNCNGLVQWSTGATGTSIVVNPTQSTVYTAFCQQGTCVSETSSIAVNVGTPGTGPLITASKNDVCPGEAVTLIAYNCQGTVQWSTGDRSAIITVKPTATTSYTAKCVVGTCESPLSVPLTVRVTTPVAPVITSSKATVCPGGTVVLTAIGCEADVMWSNGASGSSILVIPTATRTYSAVCKSGVCASDQSNLVTISVAAPTAPIISSTKTVLCSGDSVTLTAVGCSGIIKWSNGMTGASIRVAPNTTTNYTAQCQAEECTSAASNTITINVNTTGTPPVIATSKNVICAGEEVTLTSIGCSGTVRWSNGVEGNSIKVKPTTTTSYTAFCAPAAGSCGSSASSSVTVQVAGPQAPTLSASKNPIIAGESTTITALGCTNGALRWSTSSTSASLVVTPALTTTYSVVCTVGQCTSDTARITINVNGVPANCNIAAPLTQNITNICPAVTANLTLGITSSPRSAGGVLIYRKGNTPQSAAVEDSSKVTAGTYYVFEKTTTGCYSAPAVVLVTVLNCGNITACQTNPATANAGVDAAICSANTYKLSGSIGGAATSARWSSNGTGTFDLPTSLTATYFPSLADIQKGFVVLTLVTNDPDGSAGPCQPGTDEMVLTFKSIKIQPRITINGVPKTDTLTTSLTICAGDSVVLTALDLVDANGLPYTYKWAGGPATTKGRFVIRDSGTYSLVLMNSEGCSSIPSARVTLLTNGASVRPVVSDIRNTCPATTADLSTALLRGSAPGTTFVYRVGPTPASAEVASPQAVGAGTYYIFEKSGTSCFSAPAPVNVSIFSCNTGAVQTDVAVKKTVNKTTAIVGEQITYTIRLKNNGPSTATNITLVDLMPVGILYAGGSTYEVNGNVLTGKIPSLAVNDSVIVTYRALVVSTGLFTNTASITNLDQADRDTTNNRSSVSVTAVSAPTLADSTRLGVAKAVTSVAKTGDDFYDITFRIIVRNYGTAPITNLQLTDSLINTFPVPAGFSVAGVAVRSGSTLVVDPTFDGRDQTRLLNAAASSLAVGASDTLVLKVQVITNGIKPPYFNTVLGTGISAGVPVADISNDGLDTNPLGSQPTEVILTKASLNNLIGAALSIKDTVRQADGSYNVTYRVVVRNYGSKIMTNVQVTDSLFKVFNTETGATFRNVGAPTVNAQSTLAPNPDFDGLNDLDLLISFNSSLNAGASDTITFTINVASDGRQEPYINWVFAKASVGEEIVSDQSTNGLTPDSNGDGDPTEDTERVGTPLVFPAGTEIFIPEGFSPNGDGINDFFVIRNTGGQRVVLEIYNRWMTLVYKNEDYQNDWDGTANYGLLVGKTVQGLPDGTYYYVVRLENGTQFVRFLTLTR